MALISCQHQGGPKPFIYSPTFKSCLHKFANGPKIGTQASQVIKIKYANGQSRILEPIAVGPNPHYFCGPMLLRINTPDHSCYLYRLFHLFTDLCGGHFLFLSKGDFSYFHLCRYVSRTKPRSLTATSLVCDNYCDMCNSFKI